MNFSDKKNEFDLIIIGGGAAGFSAAIKADEFKADTLLINSSLPIGGTCVNVGCIPTKFLLEVADHYHQLNNSRFKSLNSSSKIDFARLIEEKNELVNSLREVNYQNVLNNLPYVTYIEGYARFISDKEVEVEGRRFSGSKFIIATGSSPKVLPIPGLKETGFLTNREALELNKLPESFLVIGAGPIGLEFAQMFSRLGSKVIVVELMERILPQVEPIVSEELKKSLIEENIKIYTTAKIQRVRKQDGKKLADVEIENKIQTFLVDEILLATGLVGNSKDLGLENVGIETDKDGFIKVDEFLRASRLHIFAAGDITGAPWLETVAAKEGNIAAQNALKNAKTKMDYSIIPYAIFTSPQIASIGIKEEDSMRIFGNCLCQMVKMDRIPKAKIINDTKGLIYMVLHPESKKILGVHIVSRLASEIIHEATLAIKLGLTIEDIIDTVHIFPTFSEAIKIVSQSFNRDMSKMSCCVE
ncbi:MAG: mercury(II) reductase [Acidobacteriota bacterium]